MKNGLQRSRFAHRVSLFFFFGALLVCHFQYRAGRINQPFWIDEVLFNFSALSAKSFWELRYNLTEILQPLLESGLRTYFWFPLFGHQEFGLRLPAFAYSVGSFLLLFVCAYRLLLTHLARKQTAVLGAALMGLWLSTHGLDRELANEARQYTLVMLLSMAWVGSFLQVSSPRSFAVYCAVSFLFLNVHFFSFPLVAFGFAYLGRKSIRTVALGIALGVATVGLNLPALKRFLSPNPVDVTKKTAAVVLAKVIDSVDLYWRFFEFICPYVSVSIVAVMIVALAYPWRPAQRERSRRLFGLLFIVTPLMLFGIRYGSNFYFQPRYFTPFFGLGVALLFLALESTLALAEEVFPPATEKWAAFALGALILFLTPVHRPYLPKLRQNFSRTYQAFEYLKKQTRPVFVISTPFYAREGWQLYWNYIGSPAAPRQFRKLAPPHEGFRIADSPLAENSPTGRRVEEFAKTQDAIFVFIEQGSRCLENPIIPLTPQLRVRTVFNRRVRSTQNNCLVVVEGARSLADIRRAAEKYNLVATDVVDRHAIHEHQYHSWIIVR